MMTKIKAPASSDDSWTPPGYVHLTALVRQYGINKVRSDLFAKRLQAYLWDKGFGGLHKIEPMFWCRDDAERWLAEGWAIRPNSDRYYSEAPLLCMVIVRVEDEPMEITPDEAIETVQSLTDEPHSGESESKSVRNPGGGRKPRLTDEQEARGIKILQNLSRMPTDAACETLRENGIDASNTTLYERIIRPAYNIRK